MQNMKLPGILSCDLLSLLFPEVSVPCFPYSSTTVAHALEKLTVLEQKHEKNDTLTCNPRKINLLATQTGKTRRIRTLGPGRDPSKQPTGEGSGSKNGEGISLNNIKSPIVDLFDLLKYPQEVFWLKKIKEKERNQSSDRRRK